MRLFRAVPSLPGLNSPLCWGALLFGAGFLCFGKDKSDYDQAVYLLAIAGVALLTESAPARYVSIAGGALRAWGSESLRSLGFWGQAAAIGYAVVESTQALQEAARHPANRT